MLDGLLLRGDLDQRPAADELLGLRERPVGNAEGAVVQADRDAPIELGAKPPVATSAPEAIDSAMNWPISAISSGVGGGMGMLSSPIVYMKNCIGRSLSLVSGRPCACLLPVRRTSRGRNRHARLDAAERGAEAAQRLTVQRWRGRSNGCDP